jgi:hypothetical protein
LPQRRCLGLVCLGLDRGELRSQFFPALCASLYASLVIDASSDFSFGKASGLDHHSCVECLVRVCDCQVCPARFLRCSHLRGEHRFVRSKTTVNA